MKKVLLVILMIIFCLGLSSCKLNSNWVHIVDEFKTHIYCTNSKICEHCESWKDLSEEELHKAFNVNCEVIEGTHIHYVVSWVV